MKKVNRKLIVFLVIVVCAAIILPFTLFGSLKGKNANSREEQLRAFLTQNKTTVEVSEAYMFVLHHQEVLSFIPCYCGCVRQGHKSNLGCFIQGNSELAKTSPFDTHGLHCPMCVNIALTSEKMYEKGVPLATIREEIDNLYKKHPNLKPTLTPKPPPPLKN